MEKTRWIKPVNLPPKAPVISAMVWWLFLDRLNAPGPIFGAVFTLLAIATVGNLIRFWMGESVDLFAPGRLNK